MMSGHAPTFCVREPVLLLECRPILAAGGPGLDEQEVEGALGVVERVERQGGAARRDIEHAGQPLVRVDRPRPRRASAAPSVGWIRAARARRRLYGRRRQSHVFSFGPLPSGGSAVTQPSNWSPSSSNDVDPSPVDTTRLSSATPRSWKNASLAYEIEISRSIGSVPSFGSANSQRLPIGAVAAGGPPFAGRSNGFTGVLVVVGILRVARVDQDRGEVVLQERVVEQEAGAAPDVL